MSVHARLNTWLMSDDTGASSKAIALYLSSGERRAIMSYPLDGWDFGRCVRLLEYIPEWKILLPAMKELSREWAILVEHWSELETLYAEDLPTKKVAKTSARIHELLWERETK